MIRSRCRWFGRDRSWCLTSRRWRGLTGSRRLMAQVEANERALRQRREELESHLIAAPAANWAEAAEKARYVIGLYAASLGAGDTQRHTLVAAVLADFERLAAEEAAINP